MCPLPLGRTPVFITLCVLTLTAHAADFRQAVEQDWLLQEQLSAGVTQENKPMTTALDAAGGCDGIKDGTYGFHTGSSASPWWQADLGAVVPICRVLVWNRCDSVAARAYHLCLLVSDNGSQWTAVYHHDGTPFAGFPDQKPLCIQTQGVAARYVRISVPGQPYLHLDEVEVFGASDPDKNIALRAPADQVSVSQWSTGPAPSMKPINLARATREKLAHALRVCAERREQGMDTTAEARSLQTISQRLAGLADKEIGEEDYFAVRWILRRLSLANPLLDVDTILFSKRVPGSFNHMSDQSLRPRPITPKPRAAWCCWIRVWALRGQRPLRA